MSTTTPSLFTSHKKSWWEYREASLNWLALGLLLAAWNAADNEVSVTSAQRPASLRGYSSISVRAAQRTTGCHKTVTSL
jgi:hypothetical protein